MAQISVQVANRIRISRSVVASGRIHGEIAAKALAERLTQLGLTPPAEPLAWVEVLVSLLEADTRLLSEVEQAYVQEQSDDPAARTTRDDATAELYTVIGEARGYCTTAFGAETTAAYGFRGPTPQGPKPLAEYARTIVGLLRATPAQKQARFGTTVDTERIADEIDPSLALLEAALAQVETEERELQSALTTRDRQLATWTTTYQSVAAMLMGMHRLAGLEELADRVKPTERRAAGMLTPEEADTLETPVEVSGPEAAVS